MGRTRGSGHTAAARPCELFPSALSPPSLPFMSHAQPASSSSNFQLIINNALDKYKKRTKNDLVVHPLAAQLQSCNSPSSILAVLHQQVQGLDQSRSSDERWSRWLDPTVTVLHTLSSTLGDVVGLVCLTLLLFEIYTLIFTRQVFSPANVIFAGFSVLLSVCILLNSFVWTILIPTYLRRLRTLVQVKKLLSTSLSVLKCFSGVSRSIQNCHGPWR